MYFHTTPKIKSTQVTLSRGQKCGDIDLVSYLTDVVGPVNLVLDLCITHECFGSIHLEIETRLRRERFESVKGEFVT